MTVAVVNGILIAAYAVGGYAEVVYLQLPLVAEYKEGGVSRILNDHFGLF